MPLQAHWRHALGDPRSLALWTVRAVFETAPSVLWNTLFVVMVVAVVVLFCALGAWIGSFEGGLWNSPKRLRRAPVLLASLAATSGPAPASPSPAGFTIARFGRDRTKAWRPSSTVGSFSRDAAPRSLCLRGTLGVARATSPAGGVIRPYDTLNVAGVTQTSLRNRFEIALGQWLDERRMPSEGIVVLPPRQARAMLSSERTGALFYSRFFMIGAGMALGSGNGPSAVGLFAAFIVELGLGATVCAGRWVPQHARYRKALPHSLGRG